MCGGFGRGIIMSRLRANTRRRTARGSLKKLKFRHFYLEFDGILSYRITQLRTVYYAIF